jgi:hypothetical protein
MVFHQNWRLLVDVVLPPSGVATSAIAQVARLPPNRGRGDARRFISRKCARPNREQRFIRAETLAICVRE